MAWVLTLASDEASDLDVFLDDRLHAFNVAATGLDDAQPLRAEVRDASGAIIGGVSGHTWGGCCEVALLWVHEDQRRIGIGSALLRAVEAEALRRGCELVTLSTHTFQAPGFYAKLGYQQVASVDGYPKGYAKLHFVKRIDAQSSKGAG